MAKPVPKPKPKPKPKEWAGGLLDIDDDRLQALEFHDDARKQLVSNKNTESGQQTLNESTGTQDAYVYSFSFAPSSSFRRRSSLRRRRWGTFLMPWDQICWFSLGSSRTSVVPMCFLAKSTTDYGGRSKVFRSSQ